MIQFKSDIYKQITAFLSDAVKQYNVPVYNIDFLNENLTQLERIEYRIADITAVGNNITQIDSSGSTLKITNYPYYNFKLIVKSIGRSENISRYNDRILLSSRSQYIRDYFMQDIDLRGFMGDLPELQMSIGGEIVFSKDIIFNCTTQGIIEVDVDNYSKWFDSVADVSITQLQ